MKTINKDAVLSNTYLINVLQYAEDEDLGILADYVTDSGKGRLTLDSAACKQLNEARTLNNFSFQDRVLLSREILAFGGNTLSNAYRGMRSSVEAGSLLDKILPDANAQLPYVEVVKDVASHMGVKLPKDASVVDAETMLLQHMLQSAFEKMTPAERDEILAELGGGVTGIGPAATASLITAARMGGFKTFQIAAMVAGSLAKVILGKGLPFKVMGMLMKSLKVVTGPIGWVVTGAWAVADMAAPAYRVTVPAVVQIAYIRQKLLFDMTHRVCECGCAVPNTAKFCGECGVSMEVTA